MEPRTAYIFRTNRDRHVFPALRNRPVTWMGLGLGSFPFRTSVSDGSFVIVCALPCHSAYLPRVAATGFFRRRAPHHSLYKVGGRRSCRHWKAGKEDGKPDKLWKARIRARRKRRSGSPGQNWLSFVIETSSFAAVDMYEP